jgi:uncharacterized protein (TIGR02646 family)
MRNVKRPKIPSILTKKAESWRDELLAEFGKGEGADKKRIKTIQKRYAHPKIKAALKDMYEFCCYCESRVNHVTIDHIEHRKPKARDKFPEYTLEWKNLHLACPNCNKAKKDQWDDVNPILDAGGKIPINEHMTYRRWFRHPMTPRGLTTKEHADLNRPELLDAREEIFWQVYDLIEEIKRMPALQSDELTCTKLSQLRKGQFGSMAEYMIDNLMAKQ